MAPVVTLLAASASQIIGSLIVIEVIFDIEGVGSLVLNILV